jgi:stage III sporulation protein AB
MLKLLGAVLVIGAAAIFGFVQATHYARRPRQIRQFIGALQRMETEIIYALTPLPEALIILSRQCSEPFSSMFRQVAERLSGQQGRSTREIWRDAVQESWHK